MNFRTELKTPADTAFASLVESFTADTSRRSGLTAEQERNLIAATREGFTAIVEDALAESREPLHLVASCSPAELVLSFFERGLPMDDARARRDPRWKELGARVDAAHWRMHGTAGSELRLIVNRPHGSIDRDAPLPNADEEPPPVAPPQEYTVRRFQPGDAPGVARAFYLTYGYAYDVSAVYDPARLIELNESGCYSSIVALGAEGVVGHYALARDGAAPIADACGAIVLPAHRGRDLLDRLRGRAEEEAVSLGLSAYYSEPVTDHARTQHASESFGAKACGITLGEAPRNFIARHMELSTTTQRQSCMLYVKRLRDRELRTIYPPRNHRAMIEAIYDELGLPIVISDGAPPKGRGCFQEGITRSDAIGTIEIEAVGEETPELVRQAADDLRATSHLGALYASLPLEDPGTPALCEAMEAYGFFFSGVGPWMLGGKDALRLQMPLTPIDLSELIVIGDFGQRLLDYVASERERCAKGNATTPNACG